MEDGLVPALGTGSLAPRPLAEAAMLFAGARLQARPAGMAKRLAAAALRDRNADLAQRHFAPGLGVLSPGSPADLAVLDVYPATQRGPEKWIDHLLHTLTDALVHAVMVADGVVLQEGRTTAVGDD